MVVRIDFLLLVVLGSLDELTRSDGVSKALDEFFAFFGNGILFAQIPIDIRIMEEL